MLDILKKQDKELALITEEENINYKNLREKVFYLSKKFKSGSINLVLCSNTIDSVIIYLSLLYAGAIPLLLSNNLDKSTIDFYKRKYIFKWVYCISW